MPLETGDTIGDLNELWPLGSDLKSEGDQHLRLIKDILKKDAVSLADTGSVPISGGDLAAQWVVFGSIMIQWGTWYEPTGNPSILVFNHPFKVVPVVTVGATAAVAKGGEITVSNATTTQCEINRLSNAGNPDNHAVYWHAIGEAPDNLKIPATAQTIGGDPLTQVFNPDGSGYSIVGQKLECWGFAVGGGTQTVTFPKAFAVPPRVVATCDDANSPGTSATAMTSNVTTTGMGLTAYRDSDATPQNRGMNWTAIGEWDGN